MQSMQDIHSIMVQLVRGLFKVRHRAGEKRLDCTSSHQPILTYCIIHIQHIQKMLLILLIIYP